MAAPGVVITFTLNGATITATETGSASPEPVFSPPPRTTTHSSAPHSTSASATPKTTESSTSSSGGPSSTSAGGGDVPTTLSTVTGSPASVISVPSSCIHSTTTISDSSDAQKLAKSCSVFSGDIVIPTGVSTPIDLTGMEALEGSLICDGPTTSGFDTLSSGTLASVRDNFTIQNTEGLSNVSFPGVLSLGALTIAGNADLLEFDGMNHLTKVDGPIHINGSLTNVYFPLINTARDSFLIGSTEDLDCSTVAPNYEVFGHPGNPMFGCYSTNGSTTIGNNGTNVIVHLKGPLGLSLKDKILAGVLGGIAFIVVVAGIVMFYLYRQTMKTTIQLVADSMRLGQRNKKQKAEEKRASIAAAKADNNRRSGSVFGVFGKSPASQHTGFNVAHKLPHDKNCTNAQKNLDALRRQRRELLAKEERLGRLSAFDRERLDFVTNELANLADAA